MKSKWLWSAAALVGLLVVTVTLLIVKNPAPIVPTIASDDIAATTKPYVVKLHAQWCAVCMATKSVWTTVQTEYAGKVKLVVFDFTNAATTAASRAEAQRLGLTTVFEEFEGETGTVLVVDGTSKETKHVLHGSRDPAEYRSAIDSTLAGKE